MQMTLIFYNYSYNTLRFCFLNPVGINKFKYERKMKWILEVSVKLFVIYSI